MKTLPRLIAVGWLAGALALPAFGETRHPAVAGSFYPADSAQLAALVRSHLAAAPAPAATGDELIALIVPHAGLVYSGGIAAHAYRLLEKVEPRTVVLCGPSHRYAFEGLSIYGPDVVWKTPLGRVASNNKLCRSLLDRGGRIEMNRAAHAQEHCLEVQLPYLQTVLHDFSIVPVLMGRQDRATIDLLTGALEAVGREENAVMISATDWQHFHSAAEGWSMDSLGMECVEDLDADRLERLVLNRTVEACGGGPTVAVLRAAVARGADRVVILKYGDSGDISGDKSSVVGYLAAAIYRTAEHAESSREAESTTLGPTAADRKRLLQIARASIKARLDGTPVPTFDLSPALEEPGAAFVTLTKQGRLRGCIGYTVAVQPLHQTVSECAVQAAVSDPRFPPVTAAELSALELEISVLTPLQPVESLDVIEVGRDGLMISRGNRRGLLLPQVATDNGWDRTEFLRNTCRKAGLPPDAYLSPETTIYRFQAAVFGENE